MALPMDGYIRVSRVGGRDETDGFISPEVQERAIREAAERGGLEVVMQDPELNKSGGTMDRPIFNDVMGRIRDGHSAGLIVYKTDRFARTLLGAVKTLAEIGEHRAAFLSATEPTLDYSTPSGKAFLHQMFVWHEFTRDSLKESWYVAQQHAVERGIHISPNSKRGGYLGLAPGDDRRLQLDEQAPIAHEMFLRAGAKVPWQDIANWLNEAAPRPNGTLWTAVTVQRLCANRIYRGEASRYVHQDKDGRGALVNKDAHPALVTEEEWQAAQMNRQLATRPPGYHSGPLLSGIARCAGCRYSMSIGYTGFDAGKIRVYRCRRRHASGTCPQPTSITAETLEEYVQGHVLAAIADRTEKFPDSIERDQIVRDLDTAREDLADFRGDRAARRKLGPAWHDWLDEYLSAVRAAEAALKQFDRHASSASDGLTRDHLLALPDDERREVLASFVDCIMIRPSVGRGRHADPIEVRTRILWAGQGPTDLPRRRVVNTIASFTFDEPEVEAGVPAT